LFVKLKFYMLIENIAKVIWFFIHDDDVIILFSHILDLSLFSLLKMKLYLKLRSYISGYEWGIRKGGKGTRAGFINSASISNHHKMVCF